MFSTLNNYRLVNDVTPTKFCENLINHDLEAIVGVDNCDVAINEIYDILTKEFDKTCPNVTGRLKRRNLEKLWVTVRLKSYIKKRQNSYYLLKQNKISLTQYKTHEKFVTNKLKLSKKNLLQKTF